MEKLVEALVGTGHWSEEIARLAIEFDFKCAYCDKDLMASVDHHRELQTDHIIPSVKGGKDNAGNWALSCRTCNTIKHIWNPLEHYSGSDQPTKKDLVKIAREYVQAVRANEQRDLDLYANIRQAQN